MNENKLVSLEEIKREKLNLYQFAFSTVQEYLLYYSWILQIAFQEQLITEEGRNEIANLIVNTIDVITSNELNSRIEDNTLQIANYLYVVTSYLSEMSNWEAWTELREISNFDSAQSFCFKAKDWILKKLSKAKLILDSAQRDVLKVNVKFIFETYKELEQNFNKFKAFDKSGAISLKLNHGSAMSLGLYIPISKDIEKAKDCFERFFETINAFCIEVSILALVDAKNFYRVKKSESEEFDAKKKDELIRIDLKYEKLLSDLRKQKNEDLNYYNNSLHKPGRKRKGCSDEVEIEENYRIQKAKLEKEWKIEISFIKKKQENERFEAMESINEYFSLIDFIKQYAVFSLSQKGIMVYPSTAKDLSQVLVSMSESDALAEFLQAFELTDAQIYYLKNNIN